MDIHSAAKLKQRTIKLTSAYPYKNAVTETNVKESTSPACTKFKVFCKAGDAGHLDVASDAVSVRIEQKIGRGGAQEMWESLHVTCNEQEDGSLAVEVVVFHPDWEEPVRIASIQSRPCDLSPEAAALRCDLEHKQL
jgi:hypothetical protein